jgi:uncharacterized membrane protein
LISRFYQLTENESHPKRMRYTAILTGCWALLITLLIINTIILTFFASLEIWSLFTNFINYIILLAMLIFEWLFRIFWFQQWFSPIKMAQQLLTVDQRQLFH